MNLNRKRAFLWSIAVLIVAVFLILRGAMYRVHPHEQVLVLQFGRLVGDPVDQPGLHWKNPITQRIVRIEKRIISWDGKPDRVPTRDKKNIDVDVFARWRIVDARLFYTSLQTVSEGQRKLDDGVDAAIRDVISSHDLIEVVRSTNREMIYGADRQLAGVTDEQPAKIEQGREVLETLIRERAAPKLRRDFGVELVDVRIKRVNYVKSVQDEVFARMKSERQRIAERFRSEAQEDRATILGGTKKEVAVIEGEAEEKAAAIRGRGDAEAIKAYADAVNQAPEFYAFLRSLEAYQKIIDSKTTLVLTTDSPLLKTLKATKPIQAPTTRPAGG